MMGVLLVSGYLVCMYFVVCILFVRSSDNERKKGGRVVSIEHITSGCHTEQRTNRTAIDQLKE